MARRLSIMSDNRMTQIANGRVNNFGYYNFKYTYPKPIKGGLFCESIFGPVKDYTCPDCGRRYPQAVHDENWRSSTKCTCGSEVEFLPKESRRYRFGYLDTGVYYVNPIAYKPVASMLGLGERALKALAEGEATANIVENHQGGFLWTRLGTRYQVVVGEGGDIKSVNDLVETMKLLEIDGEITLMENHYSQAAKSYYAKGRDLYSMFNRYVLIPPPAFRDMGIAGERVVFDEINVLYNRLVREGLRIEQLRQSVECGDLDKETADEMIQHESVIVQKLVSYLYVEGADYGKIPVQPIMESLKGKEGVVRGTMLGKRIDFSGRSIIASGPHLPIDTVGIPFDMMYELLKPRILHDLIEYFSEDSLTTATAIKKANYNYREKTNLSQQICEELCKDAKVLMNRAPSLHRYSVMAFKVKPHGGKYIQFPPLACTPFNADFDGDSLGVYLMLSKQSLEEYNMLSLPYNLLSSAAYNKANVAPGHEMVVGAYLLSNSKSV